MCADVWLEYFQMETLLFLVAGAVAGFVDAIAGGGGLITIPALLAGGVPAGFVLGTNKLQATFGSLLSAWRFGLHPGLLDRRTAARGALWTFAGAVAGAIAVTRIPSAVLARLIPFPLATVAVYVLFSPRIDDLGRRPRMPVNRAFALLGFGIGFYDGFFGPGTGSFWAVGLVTLAGFGLTRATGYTKAMNFTSNAASLAVFLILGRVQFRPALVMAVGQAVGAILGARLALRGGAKVIRPVLGTVSLVVAAWLIWRAYGAGTASVRTDVGRSSGAHESREHVTLAFEVA